MSDIDYDKAMKITKEKFSQLHEKIGSICSGFGLIEIELINAIGLLLDEVELTIGQLVSDKHSYAQTVDLFERLVKFRLRNQPPTELPDLIAKLRRAAALRNDVIHSSWSYSLEDSPQLYQERVRRKHTKNNIEKRTIPLEEFPEIIKFMEDVFSDLQTFEIEYL